MIAIDRPPPPSNTHVLPHLQGIEMSPWRVVDGSTTKDKLYSNFETKSQVFQGAARGGGSQIKEGDARTVEDCVLYTTYI